MASPNSILEKDILRGSIIVTVRHEQDDKICKRTMVVITVACDECVLISYISTKVPWC